VKHIVYSKVFFCNLKFDNCSGVMKYIV